MVQIQAKCISYSRRVQVSVCGEEQGGYAQQGHAETQVDSIFAIFKMWLSSNP